MTEPYDLVIGGAQAVLPTGLSEVHVACRDGRIAEICSADAPLPNARLTIDGRGRWLLPGIIDTQVHFREPGTPHKEDLETGTTAAVLGGVTCIFDMPNTQPPIVSRAALQAKLAAAQGRCACDYAFFVGATGDNIGELAQLEQMAGCAGVKVFMGSSTGSLLVADDRVLEQVLRAGQRRVAIHAEDDARLQERKPLAEMGNPASHPVWRDAETALRATQRIVALAEATQRPIHVLHVTTAQEMAFLSEHKQFATVEVTPQHLTLAAPDCYERLGTRAQMNPPIRDAQHRQALWQAVASGVVDVVGSDHAPHTLAEKALPYPQSPSGMPGVQTLLPLLLEHVYQGRLALERLVELCCRGPARVYGIAGKGQIALGFDADFCLVDPNQTWTIRDAEQATRCGWTPFDGETIHGRPVATILRGHVVMQDGQLLQPGLGQPVRRA